MKLLEDYDKALQAIYDHVGFEEDWVVYPIDDCTDEFWRTDGKIVQHAETLRILDSDGDYFEDEVYTQRFYQKHIYEGEEITMIFCDPHVDGMKWFRIFNNSKRVPWEQ